MSSKFQDINEYMKKSRESRREHLNLNDECIQIGGANSVYYKGLLAHFLKTTIPQNHLAYLCHACNNHKCSNPMHLYWGTPADNVLDMKENGKLTINEYIIQKYGKEKAKEIRRDAASKGGRAPRKKKTISNQELQDWKEKIKDADTSKYGWKSRLSRLMNCSHTHVLRMLKTYFPDIT